MILINELFRRNIKFIQYGRSGSILTTSDYKIVKELSKHNWTLYKVNNTFRLNPPCINLVDISDISKINQYFNPSFNFALYVFLKKKLEKNSLNDFINEIINKHKIVFKSFEYHVSFGPILNYAIKIEGSDERIYKLQYFIVEAILDDKQFQTINKKISTMFSLKNLSNKMPMLKENIEIYNKLCNDYKQNSYLKENEFIYTIDTGTLNFSEYDYILLILNDKLVFWEIHIDKSKGNDKIYDIDKLKDKRILIVDSVYSGATINYIKKLLLPVSNKIDILGIFPKSEGTFNLCNYVLLGNKIFQRDELKHCSFIQDYLMLFDNDVY